MAGGFKRIEEYDVVDPVDLPNDAVVYTVLPSESTPALIDRNWTWAAFKAWIISLLTFNLWPRVIYDNYAEDLILNGTELKQRIIYCKDLHVTEDTILRARCVYIDGDFIIDSGKTLTLEKIRSANEKDSDFIINFVPGLLFGGGGLGGLGGVSANGACAGGASGGVPFGGDGGDAPVGAEKGGGGGGGCGGAGGESALNDGGGGGGMGGAGGYGETATVGQSGPKATKDITFFIVKGNIINNGTLNNSAEDDGAGGFNAGNGGGVVVIVALGSSPVIGVITCDGANSGLDQAGGGGGGGHIEIYAQTSSFGGVSVVGGIGNRAGGDGGIGTTILVDISSNKSAVLGSGQNDTLTKEWGGWLFRFLEKGMS